MPCAPRTWCRTLVLALVATVPAVAQRGGGRVGGTVIAADGGKPIADAAVSIQLPNGAIVARGTTRADGRYRLPNVAPGTYLIRISAIGFTTREYPGTAAAASAFVITTEEVAERPALSVADHVRSIPGVDISQGGLVQSNIVARGFNNIFSGALLTLIDYRYAAVPSLRVNVPTFFPPTDQDIQSIEFVLGPGAALYGPNTASGVLNILTKSPFTSPGGTLSMEGGARGAERR